MKNEKNVQIISNGILAVLCIITILPVILLISASFSDNLHVLRYGFSFIPEEFSLGAYIYLLKEAGYIVRAYCITIFVTTAGTAVGLLLTTMLAYPLSRKDLPGNKILSFFVFFTVLFNGGLIPTYLLYTQIFRIKNTLLALIIPWLLINGFYVLLARTFFMTDIPFETIESAWIDGASEFVIYWKIIMPMSLPILATLGLFIGVGYWNDWYNGLVFLTEPRLYSLQNVLNQILLNIKFLQQNASAGSHVNTSNLPAETTQMAIAVVGLVPILLTYPFFQKYFIKGIVMGAVKG